MSDSISINQNFKDAPKGMKLLKNLEERIKCIYSKLQELEIEILSRHIGQSSI